VSAPAEAPGLYRQTALDKLSSPEQLDELVTVADVQGWVNQPATNFGWLVQGNEITLQSVKRFDSREAGAATRPQLTVVYTPSNPADLNTDGAVNAADLAILLSGWGTAGAGDINGSGLVDGVDLAALLAAWS
jgi:hypothetical protein